MLAGVLEPAELALLRTRPQRNHIHLVIPEYHTIYTAQVNIAPVSNDNVTQVTFDNGVLGAGYVFADMVQDMLLTVTDVTGTVIGLARLRKPPLDSGGGEGVFYIGTTSEIEWADDLFLTITDEFIIWPKHPYINPATGEVFMDRDVAYTNQNESFPPVVIMGPHKYLPAGSTSSFTIVGSYDVSTLGWTFYTVQWTCPGAVIDDDTNPTTDITFPNEETYLLTATLTVTYPDATTAVGVGHRYIDTRVSAAIDDPILEDCEGDYSAGGWAYRVTMYGHADLATVRDRALCLLVADDWYGNTQQSIGPIVDAENVIAIGWINGDTIEWSNDRSSVTFEVAGPQFWLDKIEGFPTGVDDVSIAPAGLTAWVQIQNLTVRKGIFEFIHWRSTLDIITDIVSMTSDTRRIATTYTPGGSLWEQLNAIANRIKASVLCDRYARVYCEIDPQMESIVTRAGFPIVQSFNDPAEIPPAIGIDWRDQINIERRMIPQSCLIDLSGVYWTGNVNTSMPFFSLAPGHIYKHYGTPEKVERIALSSQVQANDMAGFILGWMNNEYPVIDMPLSSNHRAFDICPPMYANLYMQTTDTPREIEFDPIRIIPRRVSFARDADGAILLTDVTFEAETFASESIIGDPPIEPPGPIDPPPPPTPEEPPTPTTLDIVAICTQNQLKYSTDFFTAANPHWVDIVNGDLAAANVGTFINFAMYGVTAFVLTYHSGGTDTDVNGLFRCDDITTGTFVLDQSVDDLRAFIFAETGVNDPSIFCNGLAVDSTGMAYLTFAPTTGVWDYTGWLTDTGGVMAFTYAVLGGHTAQQLGTKYSVWSDGTEVRIGYGYPTVGNSALIANPVTMGHTWNTTDGERDCHVPIAAHTMLGTSGKIIGYVDGGNLLQDPPTHNDAIYQRPLVLSDGHLFYMSDAETLRIDGAIQAIANDSGGTDGVFSVSNSEGAGFICIAGYGEIIWIASTASPQNSKRSIAWTSNGGVTWETKDGDFGAYNGYDTSPEMYPIVVWQSYTPP